MLKQEPASRGVGIPVLQGGEDVNSLLPYLLTAFWLSIWMPYGPL